MYFYIYDGFLQDKKYDRLLAGLETRLTDLGISGKIGRLTPFTTARGLIRDEMRRGMQTVVVVGNDETVAKVIEGIEDTKITLGILPVGPQQVISRALGIPEGVDACDVLSRRVTQKIDLGRVNGHFFLSHVRVPRGRVLIEGDGMYRITPLVADCEIIVSNLFGSEEEESAALAGDPKDGFLDTLITTKTHGWMDRLRNRYEVVRSVIPLRRISIQSDQPISVLADGRRLTDHNISIEIVPERLKVITGRERAFA